MAARVGDFEAYTPRFSEAARPTAALELNGTLVIADETEAVRTTVTAGTTGPSAHAAGVSEGADAMLADGMCAATRPRLEMPGNVTDAAVGASSGVDATTGGPL